MHCVSVVCFSETSQNANASGTHLINLVEVEVFKSDFWITNMQSDDLF